MAKGFTVKAKSPKAVKKPDFDYNLARQLIRGKTFVFCLPGRGVSYTFMKAFVSLAFELVQNGAAIQISQDYSSMVNFARCKCLGANVLRGPNQLPWDGKLPYDYQVWIDSDIVFNTEKFYQLILNAIPESAITKEEVTQTVKNEKGEDVEQKGVALKIDPTKEREIVAGWYCTEDGKTTSVDYSGFAWFLIKKGVFEHEQMPYPWFAPKMQIFESGEVQDMCGEDVSFCLDAKEAGFEIWCDPRIRVGHEKTRII